MICENSSSIVELVLLQYESAPCRKFAGFAVSTLVTSYTQTICRDICDVILTLCHILFIFFSLSYSNSVSVNV